MSVAVMAFPRYILLMLMLMLMLMLLEWAAMPALRGIELNRLSPGKGGAR